MLTNADIDRLHLGSKITVDLDGDIFNATITRFVYGDECVCMDDDGIETSIHFRNIIELY